MNAIDPAARRAAPAPLAFDVERARADFPILSETVRGRPLVFLDSAASAQKPNQVIDAMVRTMRSEYANVHRGLHWMSERATDAYEGARRTVANFLGAGSAGEIVFTRNSTEAINLVAHCWGRGVMRPDRAVVISELEHHGNIVPWQLLRADRGVELRVARINDAGEIDLAHLESLLADGRVGLVSISHMSNVLGTVTPAARIVELAHAHGALVLLDGSQAVVHRRVDVAALDCDFYVFTGHKLYGPSGIGVLWGRAALLDRMPPFMGGGDMIASVSFEGSTWAAPPNRFEAGTPAIVEAIGLGAAIEYVEALGRDAIERHETALFEHAVAVLSGIDGLSIVGAAADRGGLVSFTLEGAHPHDLATLLDLSGIAIRAGQHCAEPLMHRLGVSGTARASFGLYNTAAEIDFLGEKLERARARLR